MLSEQIILQIDALLPEGETRTKIYFGSKERIGDLRVNSRDATGKKHHYRIHFGENNTVLSLEPCKDRPLDTPRRKMLKDKIYGSKDVKVLPASVATNEVYSNTSRAKAEQWVKKGRARVVSEDPYMIQLLRKDQDD